MSNVFHIRRRVWPLGLIEIGVTLAAVVVVGVILAPMAGRAASDAPAPLAETVQAEPIAAPPAPATIILAGTADVRDGDGMRLAGETVRLQGVDAFELYQTCESGPCGREAKAALERLTAGRQVECEPVDHDRYGRVVAFCSADGVDLGSALVREGHALAYRRYSTIYVDEEAAARRNRAGAWAGAFETPTDWRAAHPRS